MSENIGNHDDGKVVSFPQRIVGAGELPTPDPRDTSAAFVGPFVPEYRVSCGGYEVPRLTATILENGMMNLILDRRFGQIVSRDEAQRWIWFMANAMAIAAGYSHFGSGSTKDPNPFQVQMVSVSSSRKAEEPRHG